MAGLGKLVTAFALALSAAPITDGALRAEVDRLTPLVAAARHLPFAAPLPVHLATAADVSRAALLAVGEGTESPAVKAEGQILKRLGLIPADADFGARAAQAYGYAVTARARYDAARGALVVPDVPPLEAQKPELVHEIAHAIADRRFGLRRVLQIAPDGTRRLDGDATRARLALVEGDAMLTGLEVADPRESFLGAHELAALSARLRAAAEGGSPSWFVTLGQFTHVDGLQFVARVRARRPWAAVDALWADPPASSEQILHPEKYDACESPLAVGEAALPALAGARPTASDVLGELVVRTWLATAVSPEIAERAATGWGGDRAAVYPVAQPDGGTSPSAAPGPVAWLTVWDDAGEADDFARAARVALAKLADADAATASDDDRAIFPSPAGSYALARTGEAVALLFAVAEPVEPVLDEMLVPYRPRPTRRAAPRPRRAAQPGCPRRDRATGPG